MKREYILLMAFATLVSAGCAKHEMVKSDQMIPPAAEAKAADTAKEKPAAPENAVKSEPVTEKKIAASKESSTEQKPAASLDRVYFDFDSFLLSANARDTLVRNANLMMKQPGISVRIEGNCDERGSDEYNLALGEKRAKTAKQYLVTLGIPAQRLSVISYGKEKPADPRHDEAAWAKNRRDDFAVVAK